MSVKLLFLVTRGTPDMDTALGWGHALLARGLVDGFSGSNFPIAFQIYEALVWVAEHLSVSEYAAMKTLNLLCDVGTFFGLRALLRGWGKDPDWAFAYWLSPYYLVMFWLGYDHFQLGLLVVLALLGIQRARSTRGWLLASVPLGVAFLQRPQAQVLLVVLVLHALLWGLPALRSRSHVREVLAHEQVRPIALLCVAPALLFAAYSAWFWAGGRYAVFLLREYVGVGAYSPSLSANMLNVWAMVAEIYRQAGEKLYLVERPTAYHVLAAVVGLALLVAGVRLISRGADRRRFSVTVLYLWAYGSILLPNVYTRAHENHFFLGGLLGILALSFLARPALAAGALLASLLLQGFNAFGIYGFGYTPATSRAPFAQIEAWWTYPVRFVAAGVATLLFLVLMAGLWPLVRGEGRLRSRTA